jgi:ABC-type uncharacterized transport system permease subunit
MMEFFSLFDPALLNSVFRFVTPVLLAALGGALCERAGVFNIGLEGLMLTGAFAAVVGSFFGGSAASGVLLAIVAGAAMGALFSLFVVTLRADDIVVGIGINILAAGLTVFLLRAFFDVRGAFQDPTLQGLSAIDLPVVESIPVLGPLVSGHTLIVYGSWLLAGGAFFMLFRQTLGLRLRGVGENPTAAATLGVNVSLYRHGVLIASGALCGLAGAQLSLGNVTLFVEGMSAGRGWIAVVAVMLGRAHPLGVVAASFLFGFTDAVGFRLQGLEFPPQLTEALPYIVTLASLFVYSAYRRRRRLKQMN